MKSEGEHLSPGAVVDGFRIDGLLHEGGMALLYAVSREDTALPLVMKTPKLAFGSHPACYVGFEVEQMILATLSGPGVPRLVAKGDVDGRPYLVMERIEGPALVDFARRAPLPAAQAALLVGAVASALHELHRQNVIHLDLKPANVLFRPSGEAVLIDFGLARRGDLPDLVDEEFHAAVGTGAYIAPEQLLGGRNDPRSDLFALGVVAYQLATGARPFGDPTSRRAMRRRLHVDPVPPRARNRDVPPWLQEVILRCLELQPAARYATAAQLAHDLAHPEQIHLTARARRLDRGGVAQRLRRWLDGWRLEPAEGAGASAHLALAPHVVVAVDLDDHDPALDEAMREAVHRALVAEPGLRITLVSVREPGLLTEDSAEELQQSGQVQALLELRHWARPLGVAPEKLRLHVAQAGDAAAALLDYAATHHADRIIMGARGASRLRRYLGSVSARVVAQAPCSVSVIRPRR